jgi:hypothetical protein
VLSYRSLLHHCVHPLSYALHSILGVSYDVDQEESTQSFWWSTFMKRKKANPIKQSQAWVHTAPLGFSLYNCHYCIVDCAFMLQEFNETL